MTLIHARPQMIDAPLGLSSLVIESGLIRIEACCTSCRHDLRETLEPVDRCGHGGVNPCNCDHDWLTLYGGRAWK